MPRIFSPAIGAFALCDVLLWAAIADATAQSFYGGVRGAVRDAAGVVPGVELTLTHEETGLSRTTFSNPAGEYVFIAVAPGTYDVRAVLIGYRTVEHLDVAVGTQEIVTLDISLDVGPVREEITVTAAPPLLQRATAWRSPVSPRRSSTA